MHCQFHDLLEETRQSSKYFNEVNCDKIILINPANFSPLQTLLSYCYFLKRIEGVVTYLYELEHFHNK